jgi:hypothetical protein
MVKNSPTADAVLDVQGIGGVEGFSYIHTSENGIAVDDSSVVLGTTGFGVRAGQTGNIWRPTRSFFHTTRYTFCETAHALQLEEDA